MHETQPEPEPRPAPAPPPPQLRRADSPAGAPARTPAHPGKVDAAGLAAREVGDLDNPAYFLNRELTWLNFNFRVLHEAEDDRTPLLERLKFLAIVSSNLDEFFMKRIGGLKQQQGAGMQHLTVDGLSPTGQIEACHEVVRQLEARKRGVFVDLVERLAAAGVVFADYDDLSVDEQGHLRQHYVENIHPLVTPQVTDPAHPFPFISNLSLNLLVSVRYPRDSEVSVSRVKIPVGTGIPRLIKLPGRSAFVRLEDVVSHNLDLLFPGMEVEQITFFRVTRNANTESDEERAEDLLAMIETELRDRKFAPIVRLEVADNIDPRHRALLAAELRLDEADVFEVSGMMGMRDLMEVAILAEMVLRDPPHHPVDHPEISGSKNVFHTIRDAGSLFLHHPYVSFSTSVERFLRDASTDPKVRAIKMTLYRTSATSRVIEYLIDAAQNGKQVAVAVELKARFDEAANIRWANYMEEVGIHVTYGVVGLKTHCKVILVVRQDYDQLRRYVHIGTGNYHADTARIYSDLGLLTCDERFGRDCTELFNYLTTGYRPKRNYLKILPAPKHLKAALLHKIDREIELHTEESPGLIQIKTNALEDADITVALYRAAAAGVRVDLIVRDSCRIRPGIPGLSEGVRVVSIVGRFLEHGRIVFFRNGGDEEYYIGSADLMRRNLESRVEVLVPVEDRGHRDKLRFILDTQLADVRGGWLMRADGSYEKRTPEPGAGERSSQAVFVQDAERQSRKANRLRRRRSRGPRKLD